MKLPELHSATLDQDAFEALLHDIENCTELLAVIPRFNSRVPVPDLAEVTLERARELVAARAIRGLQLRYRYQDAEWWDTVMVLEEGYRVVRIRQDPEGAGRP
jgi:hypothetical protein